MANRESVQRRTGFTSAADDYAAQLKALVALRESHSEMAQQIERMTPGVDEEVVLRASVVAVNRGIHKRALAILNA